MGLRRGSIVIVALCLLLPFMVAGEDANALVHVAVGSLRAEPSHSSELETQVLMGTPLSVDFSDSEAEWLPALTPDGYRAYVNRSSVTPMSGGEMERWRESRRVVVVDPYESHILFSPDEKSMALSDVVLGCVLVSEGEAVAGFLRVRTPDGRAGYVKADRVADFRRWMSREFSEQRILEIARSLMGVAYLWGGTSTKGVDCSGLTQLAFYDSGVILPRNASKQACVGEDVAVDVDSLRTGDLMFFVNSDGRVVHVGIYDSNGRYVHSSGMVHESGMMPDDELYNGREVASARRIGGRTMDGVTRILEHPWY